MRILPHQAPPRQSDNRLPPGSNLCRCGSCGERFLNVRAFDAHRYGPAADRSCLATPQLPGAGLERDPRGYWRLPKRKFHAATAAPLSRTTSCAKLDAGADRSASEDTDREVANSLVGIKRYRRETLVSKDTDVSEGVESEVAA